MGAAEWFLSNSLADIEFVQEDGKETIPAHKVVLSARSLFLRQILEGASNEFMCFYHGEAGSKDRVVVSRNIPFDLFKALVRGVIS